jgi:TIR domain
MSETKVFVSYSRKDADFVDKLQVGLATRGYEPVYDRSTRGHDDPDVRLSAQDEWWAQLKIMIAAADVMIFVVSPDSAASPVCDDEIAHAKSLGRRVIAILRRAIDFNLAPERLRALNVTMNFQGDESSG